MKIARVIFVCCLPLLLVTASLAVAINSSWLYQYGFVKYGVSRTTGLAPPELDKAAVGLIRYFNSSEEYINVTVVKNGQPMALFNPREAGHLKDVKALFWLDYRVAAATLAYGLGYAAFTVRRRRELARGAVWGSGATLALMLLLGAGTLFDFDQLFLRFHLLSFSNDLWQLDPARDYLIMLFPQGFWQDATVFCGLLATAMALLIGGVGWSYLRRSRDSAA